MMPFYKLSLVLAKAGIRVSYVSTSRNIQRLPELPFELLSLVTFVPIPLPALDSSLLPEGVEATADVTVDKIQHLKIVTDIVYHWTVDAAWECHVPTVIFSPFTAATKVFFGSLEYLVGDGQKRVRSSPEDLTSPPCWFSFQSSVAYRHYEAIGIFAGFYQGNASGVIDAERLAKSIQGCQVMAIRGCREFEGEFIDLYGKIIGKPVILARLLLLAKPDKTRSYT
ncbi:hypothetical protein ACSBR2_004951 [Camellia fascicularis]